MARKDVTTLRDEATKAIERGKFDKAIEAYAELERREPSAANWSKRLGETFRRAGKTTDAVAALERATEKYTATGFLVQAIAVCKLILQIDPKHSTTATRLAELVGPAQVKKVSGKLPKIRFGAAITPDPKPTVPSAAPPPAPPPHERTAAGSHPPAIPLPPPPPAPASASATEVLSGSVSLPSHISLPPGAPLDSVDLVSVVPGARAITASDGSISGMSVLPLEDVPIEDIQLEIDQAYLDAPIEARIAALDPAARMALVKTPLFAGLPPRVLERLINQMNLIELEAGELVFAEGEPGDSMFVISEGEVIVESGGRELARLGPSAFFGEIALVTELPRSATIRAAASTELLAVNRDVIREAAAEQPEIVSLLLRFVRDRLVDRVVRTSDLFRPFTDAERDTLAARFEMVEVVTGVSMIVQGGRADGLYIIVSGRAEVWRDGEPHPIATLGNGDVFGELSLLGHGASTAHVRSASRMLTLRMPASTFHEVIMTHPQVLEYLSNIAERRSPVAKQAEEFVHMHLEML